MDDESPPAKAEAQQPSQEGTLMEWSDIRPLNGRVARKSYSTLERIVTDGEIRKIKYSPIAKKRRTWAMTLRSLSGFREERSRHK
ncbi:hypothetical protein RYX36_013609, partial [Vicia faba]